MGSAVAALPAFYEVSAPAAWRVVDFISDLHLSAALPRTQAALARHLAETPADAVFILGDLFEVWVGDDARALPAERQLVDLLADGAARRHLAFMVGNRDFLAGSAWIDACGMTALADPTVLAAFGQRVLLTHGDALCLADTAYQRYRAQVRSAAFQAMALALPLTERRRRAAQMRHASEQRQASGALVDEAVDVDVAAASAWMDEAGAAVMVHGHTHRPASEAFAGGRTRHVLSDWDCDVSAPAQARAQVLRLSRDGFERLAVAAK